MELKVDSLSHFGRINHNDKLGDTMRHPYLIKSIDLIVEKPKLNGLSNEVDTTKIVFAE
jgi:hypothetical protein